MKRIISLWLPRFATDRLSLRLGVSPSEWRARAFATIETGPTGPRLAAINRAARAQGLIRGLTLADAKARLPALELCEAEPMGDAKAVARLADWCGRYSPWTAVDGPDGVWLDVTGCAHLFGGEAALLEDLAARIEALGFAAQPALADTPGAAWALARFGEERIVAPGDAARVLAALPVAALRLDAETCAKLAGLGLRSVGDLEALERGALARRFGVGLLKRLGQALGREPEPISPRRPAAPYHARLAFAEPIGGPSAIREGSRRLVEEICARLAADGRGARRLTLALYRVDGTVARTALGTSRPSREPEHLMTLLDERLEGLDAGFGADALSLLAAAEPLADGQLMLDLPARLGEEEEPRVDVTETVEAGEMARLVDRLGNRLGPDNVLRLSLRESHVPERAAAFRPAFGSESDGAAAVAAVETVMERPAAERPLRLLARPEPIEAVAEMPDAPPVLFRRRRTLHRIVRAEGPERIAPEWWRSARARCASPRDYYRLEDSEGRRYWVYRDRATRPGMAPAWYLHGVFA